MALGRSATIGSEHGTGALHVTRSLAVHHTVLRTGSRRTAIDVRYRDADDVESGAILLGHSDWRLPDAA